MRLDDAYANSAHIPHGEGFYAKWEARAARFRGAHASKQLDVDYGRGARQTMDVFHPEDSAQGVMVFIHGGYWLAGSAGMFSHLAAGAVTRGLVCAMPSYTLAPDARIGGITSEVAQAIATVAAQFDGPIYLVGHSAGGHLVARMACEDMAAQWSHRVARVMAISPLSDLAPLMETSMNASLGLDADEAKSESPIRHTPQNIPVTAWVGSDERPVFLDQATWLADAWGCDLTVDAGRHHFDVIEGLEDATSPMMRALLR